MRNGAGAGNVQETMGKHNAVRAGLVVGVLVAGLIAGCASGAGTPSGSASPEVSGMSPTPTPSPSLPGPVPGSSGPSFTPKPTRPGTPFPGSTTVRGPVSEGVEAGCMILTAEDGKIYLLLGGDRSVIARGGRIEATGRPQPGLMTTCQQGIPFTVTQVRAI